MSPTPTWRLRRRLNRRFYRCLYRFYRAAFPTPRWPGAVAASSLRRILLIRDDGYVGDVVITTPLIAFLKDVLPQVEIDVLAAPKTAPLLAADARIARVFRNDRTWRGWLRVLLILRARRYDVIFSLVYGKGLREGLVASMIACRTTYKVSVWRPKRYSGFFSMVARPPATLPHMADQLLHLGHRVLGMQPPGSAGSVRYPMRLAVDAASDAHAASFLRELGVPAFIVVNLDATDETRSWRPERCATFVAAILDKHPNLWVVLPPPPGREARAQKVVGLCRSERVVVASGFRVLELTALIRRSLAVVTPDTGVLHLAAAAGRPIVALYTMRIGIVERWLPRGVSYRAVVGGHGESVSDIPVERIVAAFDEVYESASPSDTIEPVTR